MYCSRIMSKMFKRTKNTMHQVKHIVCSLSGNNVTYQTMSSAESVRPRHRYLPFGVISSIAEIFLLNRITILVKAGVLQHNITLS